jgi:hypothetical protein
MCWSEPSGKRNQTTSAACNVAALANRHESSLSAAAELTLLGTGGRVDVCGWSCPLSYAARNEAQAALMRLLMYGEPSVLAVQCQQLVMCAALGDAAVV